MFVRMEGIDMSKKFQNAFSRQEQNSMKRKKDYMKYAQSLECTLQLLESQLHDSDDTSEVIRNVLKTACSFYQGDWAGFLQIDLELGLWTPYVWYHATTSDQTEALLHECESAEFFTRWMPCTTTMPSAFLLFGLVWCGNLTITHETLFLISFLFSCPICIVVLHLFHDNKWISA